MQRISHLLRRPTRAGVIAMVAISAAALLLPASPSQAATDPCGTGGNPVACENTKTGNPQSEWDVAWNSDTIEGFASGFSYNLGERVDLKIKTSGSNYGVDIYRMGYYAGNGARKIASVTPTAQTQPACLNQATTGLIDCGNWKVSASWTIPSTAVSGVYFAHIVRKDTGEENHVVFVVRNDASTSNILFQTSDTTWQAYNTWGGNSLYAGEPIGRAYKVSYNRPFNTRGTPGGRDFVFANEMPMIRFLERNGYDLSYFSGMDADRKGTLIKNHKMYMTTGHDEYWSGPQRTAVEAARDAGVNLALFAGNDIFWKTRWESAIDGSGNTYRTLVTYKSTHDNAQTDPTGTWTGTWRDIRFSPPADGGRPENALSGTLFTVNCCTEAIKVPAADGKMRFWRNTNIASQSAGQVAALPTGTLGYEWNEDVDNGYRPAGLLRLSSATYTEPEVFYDFGSKVKESTATHSMTMYKAASGARVFSAGTVQWSWGLDATHDGTATATDTRMQQATINLFADMGVQPLTLMSGMVAATATTDTSAPTAVITSPAAGASLRNGTTVTVTGTATDAGGGQVAGVEVSTDNGATWHPANGRGSWTYSYDVTGSGSTTIRARAVDDSGNLQSTATSTSITATCPCVFFGASQTPKLAAADDNTPTELGMRFTSSVSGYVTGVRFYKASGNTGTHTGSLWSSSGTKLAAATFSGESSTGWQTATFPTAVAITAGTDYVVSYYAPAGRYMADNETFAYTATTRAPLTAPQSTDSKPNGVYRSGSTGFPTDTYKGGNYWVDPVITTTAPADTTAPTVVSVNPANGASSVATSVKPAVQFSEAVQSSTIVMTLKTSTGTTVAGSAAYNSSTNTATFTPSAALANNTAYTVSVSGAKDTAGNTMAAALTSSFTTVNPSSTPGVCPCSIWDDATVPGTVTVNDPAEVELGVKFRSTTAGLIKAVRFYKGSTNTGTHTGSLWTSTGTQLATGTFSAESSSGWQTLTLASPVSVAANTTYVASYHTTTGNYSADAGGFSSAVTRGPLSALRDGEDGGNGVYKYGARAFPSTASGANYYVDVVYDYLADTTAPTVVGVTPASGATGVSPAGTVRVTYSEKIASGITFTLKSGSTTVAGAGALSTDGTQYTFTPTAALAAGTVYTATVSGAKDAAGNTQASALTWSFTTSGVTNCPCSLFSSDTTPGLAAAGDTAAVELGMKFSSTVDGYITGMKFYKGATNTGTHVGNLWSSDGTKLATVTFSSETSSGWQTATFSTAVAVQTGKQYVVSYFAPNGRYAADSGGFTNAVTNAPLSAPSSGTSGGNGVYAYSSTSKFPTESYASSNYYVDVVFTTTAPADTKAPTLVGTAPASSQTGVPLSSTIRATFDEALQTSPLAMTVTPAGGTAIAGTIGYDATTRTVVYSPSAALTASKVYTAVLTGVKDAAGNTAATVTWSFTTGASSSNGCPCTIWASTATPAVAAWNDPAAIEVGVKFRATTAGTVKGIRFYKGASNTGTHVGKLYSSTGTLLASATFTGETATGWQEVLFSSPVTVAAGTTYVASYYAPSGNYAATLGGLSSAVTNGPLTALANGTDGPNGLYKYGTGGGFPTAGASANYWVDVLFQ